MKAADKFGNEVMGSRMKGTKPLAFESKNLVLRMATMFQVEALNSWEHIYQDLPRDFREIAETKGKAQAALALSGVILKALIASFLLNRLDDEIYGGTPAPNDILGMTANFIASGNGLTTNDFLLTVINNAWYKETGEYLIDEDGYFGMRGRNEDLLNDGKFNLGAAMKETGGNITNEVPMLNNITSLLGWGDSTLPLAGLSSGKKVKETLDGVIAGDNTYLDLLNSALEFSAEMIPGGSQLKRTWQGIQAFNEGGVHDKNGNLRFAVDNDFETDPWGAALTFARMAAFGKWNTPEAQAYFAASDAELPRGKALSETRMRGYNALTAGGYSNTQAESIMRMFNSIIKQLGSVSGENAEFALRQLNLPNDIAAEIWQNLDKTWKPGNNPFSTTVGQRVWNDLNGGK